MRYNPFTDYDKYGCLKLPALLYLSLAYLLKGYVIWIVSLSYRQEPAALLNIFYPSRQDFYGALMVGAPALICAIVLSLRRVNMPAFIQNMWFKIRWFFITSASIQAIYSVYMGHVSWHNISHFSSNYGVIINFIMLLVIIVYCLSNQHFIDVSKQYPVEDKAA